MLLPLAPPILLLIQSWVLIVFEMLYLRSIELSWLNGNKWNSPKSVNDVHLTLRAGSIKHSKVFKRKQTLFEPMSTDVDISPVFEMIKCDCSLSLSLTVCGSEQ